MSSKPIGIFFCTSWHLRKCFRVSFLSVLLGAAYFQPVLHASDQTKPSLLSTQNFIHRLKLAQKNPGVQVGIVVDAQQKSKAVFLDIVTLDANTKPSAYYALEASSLAKKYHPAYKDPMILILSLNGVDAGKILGERKDWAFFTWKNGFWTLANKGIGEYKVEDGSILGFSLSAWKSMAGEFQPVQKPHSLPSYSDSHP